MAQFRQFLVCFVFGNVPEGYEFDIFSLFDFPILVFAREVREKVTDGTHELLEYKHVLLLGLSNRNETRQNINYFVIFLKLYICCYFTEVLSLLALRQNKMFS